MGSDIWEHVIDVCWSDEHDAIIVDNQVCGDVGSMTYKILHGNV